jgi:ABC-type branched-subunit amino acid transport system ATPase component
MGLVPARSGSIRAYGTDITGLAPNRIVQASVAYVPQGRRVWPSLTVDEHLRLVFIGDKDSPWTPERVYETFPRLGERRKSYGTQLSGGEQQMLAIGRALLANPRLLVMD